ncbi:UNVERIFIED_CONTAM: hypothetical protein PYX00_007243 [Menopon gallinae]|uniref:G domain-containing protein n=1 Tax=Menopon gallinae TaxID=328185 RepID=A0AAW2HI34_9NEOP
MLLSKVITKFGNKQNLPRRTVQEYLKAPQKYSTRELEVEASDCESKIIFNEVLQRLKMISRDNVKREQKRSIEEIMGTGQIPRTPSKFVTCLNDTDQNEEEQVQVDGTATPNLHFPLKVTKSFVIDEYEPVEDDVINTETKVTDVGDSDFSSHKNIQFEPVNRWIAQENEDSVQIDDYRFGSSDPAIPVSDVPCGGCGALLHCTNATVPGFIPKELFTTLSQKQLRSITCQRCSILKEHDVALGITVNPAEYEKILENLKTKSSLLILLILDLLDFPCSIWPRILNIIGKRPVYVVGNKIDLLCGKGSDFLNHVNRCLLKTLTENGIDEANVKSLKLISAKTGFGVEDLITDLQNNWGNQGDVYIVGCTNSGKSTLFNTLIRSDFCKVKASDVLQRATVSRWPGTTVNLLKFPILRMLSWRKAIRQERLAVAKKRISLLTESKKRLIGLNDKDEKIWSLMGYLGTTFKIKSNGPKFKGLDPEEPDFRNSKWCYDTPGVVSHEQILSLLTASELSMTMPNRVVVPRNFRLRNGLTLFIGGLARVDVLIAPCNPWVTVYASRNLPITIVQTVDADLMYQKLLGTKLFAVPHGSRERLKEWPGLRGKEVKVIGMSRTVATADIVLSSAGWVSIAASLFKSCTLQAWTPEGRGIFLRQPALITRTTRFRKQRIDDTPAFKPNNKDEMYLQLKFESR